MFEAYLYKYIYLAVVSFLTICVFFFYAAKPTRAIIRRKRTAITTFVIALLFSFFIGTRPISGQYFVDMAGYAENFNNAIGDQFKIDTSTSNILFDNLFVYLATKGVSVSSFFIMMAILYFVGAFVACRKFFPEDSLFAFLFFLAAFSTFSYSVNGVKAGVAGSLFLIAIAYRKQILVCLLFALLSLGFHHSMELPVVSLVIVAIIRNTNLYFAIWCICLILSIFHITFFQDLFASMTDEHGAGYLIFEMDAHWAEVIRFRPDFVLYSAVPVFIGFYLIRVKKLRSSSYQFILNLYLLTNSVWMLCMYATFTNRIAYLSWFMYPIVMIYPFIENFRGVNRFFYLRWLSFGHLAFTIFMLLIYN